MFSGLRKNTVKIARIPNCNCLNSNLATQIFEIPSYVVKSIYVVRGLAYKDDFNIYLFSRANNFNGK